MSAVMLAVMGEGVTQPDLGIVDALLSKGASPDLQVGPAHLPVRMVKRHLLPGT